MKHLLLAVFAIFSFVPAQQLYACSGAVCDVSAAPGLDFGEKVNYAIGYLPTTGGVLDARHVTGEINSAINIPENTRLLLGPGTYIANATITLNGGSSITGMPIGSAVGGFRAGTIIKAADNAGLENIVFMAGPIGSLRDIVLDGNKTYGGTIAGADLVLVAGGRVDLSHIATMNSSGNGIRLMVGADVAKIFNVMSIWNLGSGLLIETNDVFVNESEFENNGLDGVTIAGGSALRMTLSDLGGNLRHGLYAYHNGTPSGIHILGNNQFGNNCQSDLVIIGWSGHSIISGNSFIGSSCKMVGQSAIILTGNGGNVVANNVILMVNVGQSMAYGIRFITPGSLSSVSGNVINNSGGAGVPISAPTWQPVTNNTIIQ